MDRTSNDCSRLRLTLAVAALALLCVISAGSGRVEAAPSAAPSSAQVTDQVTAHVIAEPVTNGDQWIAGSTIVNLVAAAVGVLIVGSGLIALGRNTD
jgi:hypothetical protein